MSRIVTDTLVLVFSKDRVMQLDCTLRSFIHHCKDFNEYDVRILYITSTELHARQYESLIQDFSKYVNVKFIKEISFRNDVLAMIAPYENVLFLVDDNIFVKDFSLAEQSKILNEHKDAIGISLRLGRNTDYCYSWRASQKIPNFIQIENGYLKFDWTYEEYDFGYPLEVSSSLYRNNDIFKLLIVIDFHNPNTLEEYMWQNVEFYKEQLKHLICYEKSLTFCAPINKVQTTNPGNRASEKFNYTADGLAELYEQGKRINVEHFSGYTPNACHQEVELTFVGSEREKAAPEVTVLIPCYKQAEYLSEAVESVVEQTYRNWECIIVNDGSPDNTNEVANKLIVEFSGFDIKLLEKTNGGLPDARNAGIKILKGKYILPLDADDKIAPTYIEEAVQVLESHNEYSIVYVDEQNFGETNHIHRKGVSNLYNQLQSNVHDYCSLFRREVWERVGGYSVAMFIGAHDWNFWVSAAKLGFQSYHLEKPLFLYRNRAGTMVETTLSKMDEVRCHVILHHRELFNESAIQSAIEKLRNMPESSSQRLTAALKKHPYNPLLQEMYQIWKAEEIERVGVTVIIPTYNRLEMLRLSIESVLKQTFMDFEIIVVNDAGKSVEFIVQTFNDKRIRYIEHTVNKGLAASRNTGIRLSRGKYLCYLDDDDVFYPSHLETLFGFLETSNYKVAYTDANRAEQELINGDYVTLKKEIAYSNDYDYNKMLIGNFIPVLCIMHEKSCLEKSGIFDESLTTHEDWDLWIRIAKNYDFAHIKKVTCEYTWRTDGSTMTSSKRADMLRTLRVIYNKTKDIVAGNKEILYHRIINEKSFENEINQIQKNESRKAGAVLTENPGVSVIIPVFNKLELTKKCIESIRKYTTAGSYEIIVVDNASIDETKKYFEKESVNDNSIKYFRNNSNLGFAKACNMGAKLSRYDYILLLNNDTEVTEGWLDNMIEEINYEDKVAVVGACLLYPGGEFIQHVWVTIGTDDGISLAPYHSHRFSRFSEVSKAQQSREVTAVTGACMLIDKEAILKVGLFDESFINGFEDIDFCLRIKQAGYKIRYCHGARIYHYESASMSRHDNDQENWKRFNRKWSGIIKPEETQQETNKATALINQREEAINNAMEYPLTNVYPEATDQTNAYNIEIMFSIIIPVHNNLHYTRQCLDGISKTKGLFNIEIIIIDNASTDGTADYLKSLGNEVKIFTNVQNENYAHINNHGAEAATGKYLVFMNNDTYPFPGWLDAFAQEFHEDRDIGIQGAKLLYENGTIQHAGMVYGKRGGCPEEPYHAYLSLDPTIQFVNRKRQVQFVTGACLSIRNELFREIGGFDEEYIFGWEDTDLCMKVNVLGKKIIYNPETVLYHYESATKKLRQAQGDNLLDSDTPKELKNRERFMSKWGEYLLRDADLFYAEDGLKLEGTTLVPIEREKFRQAVETPKPDTKNQQKQEYFTSFSKKYLDRNYRNASTVLIKSTHAIGDALNLTALVADMKLQFPNLKIYISGNEVVGDVFQYHPDIEGILLSGTEDEFTIESMADVVVDYVNVIAKMPEYYNGIPFMDILGNMAGIKFTNRNIIYSIAEDEAEWAKSEMRNFKDGKKLVGVQLFTSKDVKRSYPHCESLLKELVSRDSNLRFLMLGKESTGFQMPEIYDCGGKSVPFRKQMALAKHCDSFLTIDSAFFHAGHNYFHKPTLVIFGLTNPALCGNPEKGFAYIRNESLKCLNCYWRIQCNIECMHQLEPVKIADEFMNIKNKIITNHNFKSAELKIVNGIEHGELLYNYFLNNRETVHLTLVDKENILPDYYNNANGISIIKGQFEKNKEQLMDNPDILTDEEFEAIVVNNDEFGLDSEPATGKLSDPLPSPLNLNLGCGKDNKDEYVNIDLYSNDGRVVGMDIRKLELPDECADTILANDVLEHFSHRETDTILKEWVRMLKPGGELTIRCPSLKLQCKAYMEGLWSADIASYMIFGGQTNPGDYHKTGFDEKSIRKHLEKAGIEVTDIIEDEKQNDKNYINLNMTIKARKPVMKEFQKISTEQTKSEIMEQMPMNKPSSTGGFDFNLEEETNDTELQPVKISGNGKPPFLNVVWEGSQFVYHSLALINREHCSNIIDTGLAEVTIIPYENDRFVPEGNPKYEKLKENDIRFKADVPKDIASLPYVWIRHQWPPKSEEPKGAKWIIMQPWEFTTLRKDFVDLFMKADEIWTPSTYSRQSMINSGLDFDKVQVIPNGIDPQLFTPNGNTYYIPTKKRLKFLYVGGTIFRKGIDVLLQAYTKAFTAKDDVCLFIKDMGGESFYKGQTAKEYIEKLAGLPEAAEIVYYDEYMTEEQIANLYRSCDVFVCPYRGEGFSLPTLESMACGLPVIVTEGGSTDDFVDENVGWLIPATRRSIGDKIGNLELTGEAFVLEPDAEKLTNLMNDIYKNPAQIFNKGLKGSFRARTQWTWNKSTVKIFSRLDFHYGTKMAQTAEETLTVGRDGAVALGEADLMFDKGDFETAKGLYNDALDSGEIPEKYRLHAIHKLALISIGEGNNAQSLEYVSEAETLNAENPDSLYLRAKIHALKGEWTESLELLTKLMNDWKILKYETSLDVGLDDLLCDTAEGLFELGDIENSQKLYTEALNLNGNNPYACYGSARCFISGEAFEEAGTMLEWAVRIKPDFKEAGELLAEISK